MRSRETEPSTNKSRLGSERPSEIFASELREVSKGEVCLMDAGQLQRGCEKLIEELPEFEAADELMISASRHAVGSNVWIAATPEERTEFKREIYRALKAMVGVKLSEDSLMREDLEELKKAIAILESDNIYGYVEEYPGLGIMLGDAVSHIKKAMQK